MVKQGDIIKVSLNPVIGHEQKGYRPVLVISNDFFNRITGLAIVCPISNSARDFPLHIELDERIKTTGRILCQHIKSIDAKAREYSYIETVPPDIFKKVLNIIQAEIE